MKSSPAIRVGSALVGVAATLALAGCAAEASSAESASPQPSTPSTSATPATPSVPSTPATPNASTPSSPEAGAAAGEKPASRYRDGKYSKRGTYSTPETVEKITVSITLKDDIVTAVKVTGDPQVRETERYQQRFIGGISQQVVGKKLDEISVHRVSGSSLTSGGFTKALAAIRAQAAEAG